MKPKNEVSEPMKIGGDSVNDFLHIIENNTSTLSGHIAIQNQLWMFLVDIAGSKNVKEALEGAKKELGKCIYEGLKKGYEPRI